MKVTSIFLEGALLIEPAVFNDSRGYFFESYNQTQFSKAGIPGLFVQDNQSLSSKHVLRGLHFQKAPYEQGKLVRVISGEVLDVIVDIRPGSATYGQNYTVKLSGSNNLMLWIPPGFAHGFLALQDNSVFVYKCTQVYHKESESGIIWNDPELAIDWGLTTPIVSEKDSLLPLFSEL